jgi:hypothetical protein
LSNDELKTNHLETTGEQAMMIAINLESDTMKKANRRAMLRPAKVRMIRFRLYEVTNDKGASYNVRFDLRNGHKVADCSCAGGQSGQLCYHVASALPLHIHIAKTRR